MELPVSYAECIGEQERSRAERDGHDDQSGLGPKQQRDERRGQNRRRQEPSSEAFHVGPLAHGEDLVCCGLMARPPSRRVLPSATIALAWPPRPSSARPVAEAYDDILHRLRFTNWHAEPAVSNVRRAPSPCHCDASFAIPGLRACEAVDAHTLA